MTGSRMRENKSARRNTGLPEFDAPEPLGLRRRLTAGVKTAPAMIRFLLRTLGLLFLATAFVSLGYDGKRSIAANMIVYLKTDKAWSLVHAASLQQLLAWIERSGPPWLWDPVVTTVLDAPVVVVLAIVGAILILLGNKSRRRNTGLPGFDAPDALGLRRRLTAGVAVASLFVAAVFGLAPLAQLSGAVMAPGTVVVEGNSKKVQHAQGGIVSEIFVRNGSRVAAGEVVVRLDGTQARATLGIISSQLAELTGRKARLVAERDGAADVVFPDTLASVAGADATRIIEGEIRLFRARRASNGSRKAQLSERIKQLQEEINGSRVQHGAKLRELALIKEELLRVNDLYQGGLLPVTRVVSLQRDEARIDGENGMLIAQIARLRGQVAEIELQIGAVDQTVSSDAQKEIREIEERVAELQDRKIAAEDQLRRIEIRAPIDGVVHELATHTVGGVIGAGEQLMLIVPHNDVLSVEVRIQTSDIDQIHVDQRSVLRFPAFHQQSTPEGSGRITRLAPDASREQQTGQTYFVARITPDAEFLETIYGRRLVPGMPVEVFIETAPRSVLSYVTKPLTDRFAQAFRER